MRKTKIVITLGPSTESLKSIKKLIKSGVDVFRLNFSHATHDYHQTLIKRIREASKLVNKEVAILQDISGPKIRIAHLKKPMHLKSGDLLTLSKEEMDEAKKIITISYPDIIDSLKVGELIYFSDGTIRAKIVEKTSTTVRCKIITAQTLHSKKGINFPNSKLTIDAITPKDEEDLLFGARHGVDLVALSFVNSAKDIKKAKSIVKRAGTDPSIFAKIETKEAIKNIKTIIDAADGIMVARGDLGVELGVQKVPTAQKKIINAAREAAKPTITATQMLTSMINSPYPTRAEISDIANAVLDGSDAVMLSDETTIGEYPVKAVKVLHDTIVETEKIYPYYKKHTVSEERSIAAAVATLAQATAPHALITFSLSGKSACLIAHFRPKERILAVSYQLETIRKLQVVWGVKAIHVSKRIDGTHESLKEFLELGLQSGDIDINKNYVLTIGYPNCSIYPTNDIKILSKETMEYILGVKGFALSPSS